ncbi:hypothetical protein EDC14_103823 [Hydrogenispora ethanolica]|uniref:DUF2933 family protein n=1 Tax=Hydrogenispora ethanolica TaxID=1082276 RepID=A0A4R1R2V9_HYDET|nr:hypothetical protein [Hydrogenispora ethanolica]TCL59730.1 hypothetical protein EDC14_103823 [Hydrogenispora ethanolica]
MSQDVDEKKIPPCHQGRSGKDHRGHMLLMVLCCLIPLGIAFFAPAIGVSLKWSWLASLICPLLMIGMMVMMCLPKKEKK